MKAISKQISIQIKFNHNYTNQQMLKLQLCCFHQKYLFFNFQNIYVLVLNNDERVKNITDDEQIIIKGLRGTKEIYDFQHELKLEFSNVKFAEVSLQ